MAKYADRRFIASRKRATPSIRPPFYKPFCPLRHESNPTVPQACKFIAIDLRYDNAGEFFGFQGDDTLPFVPARLHVVSGFHEGAVRDSGALNHDQVIVLLAGQAIVDVQSEQRADRFDLSNGAYALHIPTGHSITLTSGEDDTILLVLGAAVLNAGPLADQYLGVSDEG